MLTENLYFIVPYKKKSGVLDFEISMAAIKKKWES
jgi:hypothetical protein